MSFITRNYSDGNTLTEAHLDEICDDIENLLEVTKLDGATHIQTGGIATANLADNAVTAAKIATSVAGSGLAGGAGTALSVNVDDSTIEINSDSLRLKDSGITTAKIGANQVTRAKLEAVGQQTSSSSSTFSTTSGSFVDVTNLTVTITTAGRPVMLMMVSDASGSDAEVVVSRAATSATGFLKFLRDSTEISRQSFSGSIGGATSVNIQFQPAPVLDVPSAGTYTYKVQAQSVSSATVSVTNYKLVAYEL